MRMRIRLVVASVAASLAPLGPHACGGSSRPAEAVDAGSDTTVEDVVVSVSEDAESDVIIDVRGACQPDPSTADAAAVGSLPFQTDACTYEQIYAVIDCLLQRDEYQKKCESINDAAAATCMTCLLGEPDGGRHGAFVVEGDVMRTNLAGCVDGFVSPYAPSEKCATRIEAARSCASTACARCSSVSLDAYESCRTEALRAACAKERAEADGCIKAASTNGDAAACGRLSSFPDQAFMVGVIYCMSPDQVPK